MSARVVGWEIRLQEVFFRMQAAPFAWGRSDCCQGALDAIEAVLGWRPAPGNYKTLRGAGRILRRAGGMGNAVPFFVPGAEEIPPLAAQRGDLILLAEETSAFDGAALGICAGEFAWTTGAAGAVRVPMGERWLRAWRL